jgi:hypothetical protein
MATNITKQSVYINLQYKDESVCVCMCLQRPAAPGPIQALTPKFSIGSSFHLGSAPSRGATPNVDPGPAHFCSLAP